MIPDSCSFCKGKLVKGNTEFVVRVENEVLAIKGVLAYICEECGEAYYTTGISGKIDGIMKKLHNSTLLVHPLAAGKLSLEEATV